MRRRIIKLSYESIQNRTAWEQTGVTLPRFDWKDMAAETFSYETADNTCGPYDNLSFLVTLMPDGNMEKPSSAP